MESSIWQLQHSVYPGSPIYPDDEIRVLLLHPGNDDEEIVFGLDIQPIDHAKHADASKRAKYDPSSSSYFLESYDALSYSWGSENNLRHVHFNEGGKLPVTKNLYGALRRLRSADNVRRLWVDQLCIDQKNIEERNRQISHMDRIYGGALNVLVWLGDTGAPANHTPKSDRQYYKQLEEAVTRTHPSWWTRAWVVQEFANAQGLRIFHFGTCRLSHSDFNDLIGRQYTRRVFSCRSFKIWPAMAHVRLFSILAAEEIRQKTVVRVQVLTLTECQNPRDKVFSLLTFMSEEEKAMIKPDYDKTVDRVYAEATYAWISAQKSLSPLILVSAIDQNKRSISPSWAVDYQSLHSDNLRLLPLARTLHFVAGLYKLGPIEDRFGLDNPVTTPWCSRQDKCEAHVIFNRLNLTLTMTALRFDQVLHAWDVTGPPKVKDWFQAGFMLEKPSSWYSAREQETHEGIMQHISENDPYEMLSKKVDRIGMPPKTAATVREEVALSLVSRCFRGWDMGVRQKLLLSTYDVAMSVSTMFHGASFFMTEAGFLGLGPPGMQAHDLITLPYGSRTPVTLRRHRYSERWQFKSLVYVHGIMEDEILERLPDVEFEEKGFVLA